MGNTVTVEQEASRRVIPTRSRKWAVDTARRLQQMGATPNAISMASVLFAAIGCAMYIASGRVGDGPRAALLILAALSIPLRLLCNMLDGMLAVEGQLQSPTGDLFNELPDRFSDALLLAGAGYAISGMDYGSLVGWIAATLAILTAYVRTLGAAQGLRNHFDGPMAKPQRMHVLIAATLLSLLEPVFDWPTGMMLLIGLAIIALGSALTIAIRLRVIAAKLNAS